jgi:hypothetical protein
MKKSLTKINTLFDEQTWQDKKYANLNHPLDHWTGMPEFSKVGKDVYCSIKFLFDNEEQVQEMAKMIGQTINTTTDHIYYPPREKTDFYKTVRYVSDRSERNMPKYPIYIPSKGRWDIRMTSDELIRMGVKHYMIVEQQQLELYKQHTDPDWVTLLVLPKEFQDKYDTCDDLGYNKSKGSGAARNFGWEHSKAMGFKRHWMIDDNIRHFYRMNNNKRVIVSDGALFRAMEDHSDQYQNVFMSGPNYVFFAIPDCVEFPTAINTRLFSCNLILNEIPQRWRGRYNEDAMLSLDILKAGGATIQYYAFLTGKMVTQSVKGGNTEELYSKDGTLPKAKMLEREHPEHVEVVWKFNRWHHNIDYGKLRQNKLIPVENPEYNPDPEYGMKLVKTQ